MMDPKGVPFQQNTAEFLESFFLQAFLMENQLILYMGFISKMHYSQVSLTIDKALEKLISRNLIKTEKPHVCFHGRQPLLLNVYFFVLYEVVLQSINFDSYEVQGRQLVMFPSYVNLFGSNKHITRTKRNDCVTSEFFDQIKKDLTLQKRTE